jgi:hypothetical protein
MDDKVFRFVYEIWQVLGGAGFIITAAALFGLAVHQLFRLVRHQVEK